MCEKLSKKEKSLHKQMLDWALEYIGMYQEHLYDESIEIFNKFFPENEEKDEQKDT